MEQRHLSSMPDSDYRAVWAHGPAEGPMAGSTATGWRYHPQRDALLAEAHARPFTPLTGPALVTRIATLSGQDGEARDRDHMAALCRRLGQPEPGPTARWAVVDGGSWRLRWERHTELSTWTGYRV
jgi:uncharacterized membrane-anchored protein